MKSIKILTVAVVVLSSLFFNHRANAQLITGAGLGLNYNRLTGLDNSSGNIGGNFRNIIGYRFSNKFALHLEPATTIKGGKWEYDIANTFVPNQDSLFDNHQRGYTLFYAEAPLLAIFSFPLEGKGIIPYDRTTEQDAWLDLFIGPHASMSFGGVVKETKEEHFQENNRIITTETTELHGIVPPFHLNLFDIGLTAGVGVRFYLGERWRFITDLRYSAGMLNINYGAFERGDMLDISNSEFTVPGSRVTNHVASWNFGFIYEWKRRR